ncbi:MAG: PEP-CTERM sorting domain-containing protein [Geobacter sp.]|nr:MAG: PEP-CTERM sorting domain-containing protein [Geobacter sp.]
MKKFFLSVVMLLSMVSFAQAYTVSFDWDGTGAASGLTDYEAFQLNSYSPIITYQNAATGVFTEAFTVFVFGGYTPGATTADPYFAPPSMKIDLALTGQYVNDQNIFFTGGSATMYDATNQIATFDFDSALISQLSGSLLQDENLGMKIDFAFEFLTVNPNYWGPVEQELVGKKWLLSVVGGRIDQSSIDYNANNNEYEIAWVFPGARMEFEAVPEPSTILLLGSGLLGVALFGRRKFAKKG